MVMKMMEHGGAVRDTLERAAEAINRGDYQAGQDALAQVLKRQPNNAAALFWKAYCERDEQTKQACYQQIKQGAERPRRR